MDFKVKTEKFEGPLELLLELIEKRKLLINEVSLSKVSDDFIEHIKSLQNFPMQESSDFILIASTLLLIKSKSLLPGIQLTEEERGDIKNLEKRLQIYKIIKNGSELINKIFGKNLIFQTNGRKIEPLFSPDQNMTTQNIYQSVLNIIKNLPQKDLIPKTIVKKVISLEEMIENLTKRVQVAVKMSFKEFAGAHKGEKVNVIVGFLAMLELVKNGIIQVNQQKNFEEIHMETNQIGIPRYF